MLKFVCLFFLITLTPASARVWKSTSGDRTIDGELVKHDATRVTIRLANGTLTTFEVTKLHADDQKWLKLQHQPAPQPAAGSGVFDGLNFGDSSEQVRTKLRASKFVALNIPEDLIARTGLNGVFQLKVKVGNLDAALFFEWTEENTLKEIQIRTATLPAAEYEAKLCPCLQEFIALLTNLHGQPVQAIAKFDPKLVTEGSLLSSHVWKIEQGGSALLGIGCEKGKYQVVVRLTEEKIAENLKKSPAPKIEF